MSKTIPAHNFCNSVFDGTHDTPKPCENGHPLILSKNIQRNSINLQDTYNISEEDYNAINARSKVSQWDILFSMIGTVGSVYLEKSKDIPYAIKNMGVFSTKDELKAKWLYYYLQTNEAKSIISNYLNGAVQKFLPLGFLREFPVREMPRNAKEIISVLENIDSKIDNNNAIAAELEGMAKDLYDYWFVQFDFPDENGKPYKSSGGKMVWNEELKREIPEGWEVDRLGKACDTLLGGTPDTENALYWNGDIPWLNSGEVATSPVLNAEKTITKEGLKNSATSFASAGAVVMSITRYIRPSILGIDACFNQSVIAVIPNEQIHSTYLYMFMLSQVERYMRLRTGAQQPHINKETVDSTLITLPVDSVLNQFYDRVEPLFERQMIAMKEAKELESLRDFLLPILMNGQVKVKGA